ncbi:hypothetical protein [Limosilactobacillus ingluviei]|uniref:hypothetical protein n=1 Tax=Limosilactobacillus ingluviei TaxID=148604 RepID=UPI0002D33527|nr:hypothetical protein [Limosilactobacillus ingluviei]
MVKSISIRNVKNFDIPTGLTEITKANVPLGTINRTQKTLTTESKISFEILKCTFSKDINEEISAYIPQLEEYISLDQFKKKFAFNMYYSKETQLLFSEAITPVTKSFLSALKDTPQVTFDFSNIHFDFDKISPYFEQTKGIRFNSNDQGVNNKTFNGTAVDENTEALLAIQNDDATQIIGVMDIGNTAYTISITQSGTLVVYNRISRFDEKEVPMLEFAVSAFQKLQYIH